MENNEQNQEQENNSKYPKSVFFIISNEFCERFSFYGMRAILSLYLTEKLLYSQDIALVIYHIFITFAYLFPLIGAILADSWLGKFKTIFFLSIIYVIGQFLLSATAVPTFSLPGRELSLLALFIIAFGTGGIKPCVSAFGGDQFVLPQQAAQLATFFSIFYGAINAGSLISMIITPVLREDIVCFGDTSCYSLAFFVPCVLMVISTVILLLGKPFYTRKKPEGNVVANVVKCICHAISRKIKSSETKEHWLDHADDEYGAEMIDGIKSCLQVLILFIPAPLFWALYDQQGSRWTFQATSMNGDLGFFTIKPDQMQAVNPILIILFIPLFEFCIYPIMAKLNLNKPLIKLVLGGVCACVAFLISAQIEYKLEKTYPVMPSKGLAQVRIFNTLNCPIDVNLGDDRNFTLQNLEMWDKNNFVVGNEGLNLNYNVDYRGCPKLHKSMISGSFHISEAIATSLIASASGIGSPYTDSVNRSIKGEPYIRAIIDYGLNGDFFTNSIDLKLVNVKNSKEKSIVINRSLRPTERKILEVGVYDIFINKDLVVSKNKFKLGGVYTIVGTRDESGFHAKVVTVTNPNSLHMLWLLPQYIVMTAGEVMFSITALEFAFTQASVSMKSFLTAAWLLTSAFGDLIVAAVAGAKIFDRELYECLFYAALMAADVLLLGVLAKFYKNSNSIEESENVVLVGMPRTLDPYL